MAALEVGNLEMLVTVLTEVSNPDNQKSAEEMLKGYMKDQRCLNDLLTVLTTEGVDAKARIQAAIQLTKLKSHYKLLADTDRKTIEQMTLSIITNEQDVIVCYKLCEVAAILFNLALKKGEDWPELFAMITQFAQHEDEKYREMNFELVERLFEVSPRRLSPLLDNILSLLNAGIAESSDAVQCAALKASHAILTRYSELNMLDEINKFLPIVAPIIQCTLSSIQNGDEDVALQGLEFIGVCCASEFEAVDAHLEQLLPFLVQILKTEADTGTKKAASQCIRDLFENEKRARRMRDSTALLSGCLTELVRVVSDANKSSSAFLLSINHQDEADENEDADYDPEEDVEKMVLDCINTMACCIPSKNFHPLAFQLYSECMSSSDLNLIKGGCLLFSAIIEGCSMYIVPQLSKLMAPLLPLLDPNSPVNIREVAFYAFIRLHEECDPEIFSLYESYFPYFAPNLMTTNPYIHICISDCIYNLAESIEEYNIKVDIDAYVDDLFGGFSAILSNGTTANDVKVAVFDAIGGIATLMQERFATYASPILQAIAPNISSDDKWNTEVCAHALEAFGLIAVAVGKDVFREFFDPSLKAAVGLLQANVETLNEYVFLFIQNTAACMGEEYEPYLSQLVPAIVAVISQKEEVIPEEAVVEDDDDEEGEDVNDEDDEGGGVEEGFIATKIAAIGALGELMRYTNAHFAPYVQPTVALLLDTSKEECPLRSHLQKIKNEVLVASINISYALKNIFGLADPEKGSKMELSSDAEQCVGLCLSVYVNVCTTESDPETASKAIMAAYELFEILGLAALDVKDANGTPYFSSFEQIVAVFLQKQAESQHVEPPEDGLGESDPIRASMELIGIMARCVGSSYLPYFDKLAPLVVPYLDVESEYFYHAIGCFGDVVKQVGTEECFRYCEPLLPHIQAGLCSPDGNIRHNSAFAIVGFVDACPQSITAEHYQHFLTWLMPVISQQTESVYSQRYDIENAISAAMRIAKTGFAVPFDQVMPAIIEALPVRCDSEESPVIYEAIFSLLSAAEPTTTGLLPKVLSAFAFCLSSKSMDTDATKAAVATLLKAFYSSNQELVTAAAGQIADAAAIATLTAVFQ